MILRVLLALLLLLTPSAFAQTGRPPVVVETVADAMARGARPGEELIVRNCSASRPWASPRQFTAQSSTNAHDGVHYLTNMTAGLVYISQDRFAAQQDVRWFGAIMTNTVDSSAAIQAAINYGADDDFYPATGRRGITVSIPAGELLVTNSVQLKAGTRLVGAGHENTVIFTAITNADTIYYNDTVAGIAVVPEVSGLAINQTTNAVPTSGAGIHFYATLPGTSVSPLVRDVLVRRTYRGIVIDTAFQGLLDHVRAFSCVDDGFRIEQSADGIDSTSTTFLSCYAAANGGDGYDLIGSYHTLLGCASDSNGGYGYRGNRSAAGYTLSNVTFNSCGAEANTLGGVYLLGAFATRFEGTIYGVSGNGHGITLDSGAGLTVSGRISSISVTNKWGVYLTNSLGYYPTKVSILTDEIGDWGLGRVSNPELVAYLSDSWKGPYPSVVYGTKPTTLPAGLTLAPILGGDGTYNIGTYITPAFSTNATAFTAAEYVAMRYSFSGSQTLGVSRIIATPLVSSGSVAYQLGEWIQDASNGTSANVGLLIGNAYPPANNFSIAVTSTNESRFSGLLSATTVRSTDTNGFTVAEMTTGGYVKAPFFHTTATNLTTAQPLIKIGENTRYQQEGVVQVGGLLDFWFNPTNTTAAQYGLDISYRANPLTQIGNTYGINLTGYAQTAAAVGSLYGIGLNSTVSGGGTVNTLAGAVIFNPIRTSGTINNSFGLLIADQTAGAANHAIYTGLGKVYHGDTFEVGATKAIIFGGVSRTNWPFYDGVSPNANVLALSTATGGAAGRVLSYVDSTTFAWSNAPSSFSFSDLTNALLPGANVTFDYTSTNITVNATTGSGSTNGTPVSVDGGATLSAANFADGSRVGFSASGTNVTADIVANSIRTNELATAAVSYLLDRGNHTGTQDWSTITGEPTTLSGYGITDAQPLDADLTRIAGVTWAEGDFVYRDSTGLTNFASTSAGRTLLAAADAAAQRTALSLGAMALKDDAPTNSNAYVRSNGTWAIAGTGGGSGTVTSVGLTVPSGFSVSGSPVTTSGTLAVTGVLDPVAGGTGITNTSAAAQVLLAAVDEVDQLTTLTLIGGTPTAIDSVARTTVRKNSGAEIGSRRRLNFIEGTNTTLTITDDAGNEELDIIVSSAATAGSTNVTYTTNYLTVPIFVADTTNVVASDNTTETNILTSIASWGSTNIALGALTSGSTLRLRAGGTFTDGGDGSGWGGGVFRWKIGGLTVSAQFKDAESFNPSNDPWVLDATLNVVSAGSSATVAVSGGLLYKSADTATYQGAATYENLTFSGTLDTTTNNAVALTFDNASPTTVALVRNTATLEWVGKETILGGGSGSGSSGVQVNGVDGVTNLVNSATATWTKTNGTAAVNIATVSTSGVGLAPQITASSAVLTASPAGVAAWKAMNKQIASWTALDNNPGTNASTVARFAIRGDGQPSLVFTNDTALEANFTTWIPSSMDLTDGLQVTLAAYSESTFGTSNIVIQVDLMRLCCTGSGALDTNNFTTSGSVTSALPTMASVPTNLLVSLPTLTNIAAGDLVRMRLTRVTGSASDTNAYNMGVIAAKLEAR